MSSTGKKQHPPEVAWHGPGEQRFPCDSDNNRESLRKTQLWALIQSFKREKSIVMGGSLFPISKYYLYITLSPKCKMFSVGREMMASAPLAWLYLKAI